MKEKFRRGSLKPPPIPPPRGPALPSSESLTLSVSVGSHYSGGSGPSVTPRQGNPTGDTDSAGHTQWATASTLLITIFTYCSISIIKAQNIPEGPCGVTAIFLKAMKYWWKHAREAHKRQESDMYHVSTGGWLNPAPTDNWGSTQKWKGR